MAQAFTSYLVKNDAAFQAAVDQAIKDVGDLTVPFNLILKDFYRSEQAIFKLQGPGQYPKISEVYARRKEKAVGFRYPLLIRGGALSASLLSSTAVGSIARITKTELVFGTSVKNKKGVFYPNFHQSDEPRSKIPLRKFLFIGPESGVANSDQAGRLQRWLGYIHSYVRAKIKLSGVANDV